MKHHHQKKGPTQRQLRVGEQLRHVIAEILQRGHFHDPVLLDAGKVTVTEVRITPDLKNAKAYVMSLGGQQLDEIIEALNEASSYFQKEINRKTELKFTPRLRFVEDQSFEQAGRIEEILREIPKPKEDY